MREVSWNARSICTRHAYVRRSRASRAEVCHRLDWKHDHPPPHEKTLTSRPIIPPSHRCSHLLRCSRPSAWRTRSWTAASPAPPPASAARTSRHCTWTSAASTRRPTRPTRRTSPCWTTRGSSTTATVERPTSTTPRPWCTSRLVGSQACSSRCRGIGSCNLRCLVAYRIIHHSFSLLYVWSRGQNCRCNLDRVPWFVGVLVPASVE